MQSLLRDHHYSIYSKTKIDQQGLQELVSSVLEIQVVRLLRKNWPMRRMSLIF